MGTSQADYARDFGLMVDSLRDHGVDTPLYVAVASRCGNDGSDAVRAAQRAVADPRRKRATTCLRRRSMWVFSLRCEWCAAAVDRKRAQLFDDGFFGVRLEHCKANVLCRTVVSNGVLERRQLRHGLLHAHRHTHPAVLKLGSVRWAAMQVDERLRNDRPQCLELAVD